MTKPSWALDIILDSLAPVKYRETPLLPASEITPDMLKGLSHSLHRSPYAAGGADYYYGRFETPNFAYNGYTYKASEMTPEQIAEYHKGYAEETDRKDWGYDYINNGDEE